MVNKSGKKPTMRSEHKDEWTFRDISTRKYTHAIHLYPARMHPEIARRLIHKYTRKKTDIVLDPFMGSGGVLLEAILHGNNTIGFDINPFAVLLSKVKTTLIKKDIRGGGDSLEKILKNSKHDSDKGRKYPKLVPSGYDVDAWFSSSTINTLAILKHNITNITNKNIQDFFKICLSLTIRKSSYQRNNSWKIHKIPESDRAGFNPDPIKIFSDISSANINKMDDLIKANPLGTAWPLLVDSRDMEKNFTKLSKRLDNNKVNLIVTSPPYGDHKTTVAYGQFSRHSGHWLDLPNDRVLEVDKIGLGGRKYNDMDDLGSATLNKTLDKIHKNDVKLTLNKTPCRVRESYAFFFDLDQCLDQISQNISSQNSHACFVVANRTVRRVIVPTDVILTELGKKYGLKVKDLIYRNIPNKAMPSKNAPENITNETGNTMTKETIIIMRC